MHFKKGHIPLNIKKALFKLDNDEIQANFQKEVIVQEKNMM